MTKPITRSQTPVKVPSLREKIGQMLIIGFAGKHVDENSVIAKAIRDDNIGGVILFDYNYQTKTFDKNIESPQQVTQLNQSLQALATDSQVANNRPHLPLLISVDYEGGKVTRLKSDYGFPDTLSAAEFATLSPEEAKKTANTMAKTLQTHGFNVSYAPMLDVNVNADNPIVGQLGRSYSEDAEVVSQCAQIVAQSLADSNLVSVFKHFPGHGSSTADSHLGFVDVSGSWSPAELAPYKDNLNTTPAQMVMTAHIINRQLDSSGLPATLSKPMLTDMLRNELGFDGVIISDDMQMLAISEHFGIEQSLEMAINAGVDMFIYGNQLGEQPLTASVIIDTIERLVINHQVNTSRIDEAYRRIARLKRHLVSDE